jgi:hypothetical protein
VTIMVDADHAHCEVTGRSMTRILVFINSTPVSWYSKMQKTVETSTYGSELVAARIATDIAMEFSYFIRMMGFALDGPVNMFGDKALILNTTIPSSHLKKKDPCLRIPSDQGDDFLQSHSVYALPVNIACGRCVDETIGRNSTQTFG